jgi:hypothetical protein
MSWCDVSYFQKFSLFGLIVLSHIPAFSCYAGPDRPLLLSDSAWYQFQVGGSIYDAGRDVIAGRWSPGFQLGWRFKNTGSFINIELDQSFDLTQELTHLDVIHLGAGVEVLHFAGRARSSISAGAALLRSETDIDSRGSTGWYLDLRPTSLRWKWGMSVVELTPLSLDISIPAARGIPLILFGYFTIVSLEWTVQPGMRSGALDGDK